MSAIATHAGQPGRAAPDLFALSVAYASAADRRDVAAFVDVFTADGTLRVSAPGAPDRITTTYCGPDELARVPARLGRYHRTYHLLGQADLRSEGASGGGQVHCVAHHLERDGGGWWDRVLHIRYADAYRADADGRWRIADRLVQVDWAERRSALPPDDAGDRP